MAQMADLSIKTDEDWTEEEIYVYVDYGKFIPQSEILDPDTQLKIIGLDKDKVYSEVNGKLFAGTYVEPIGTQLFFTEQPPQTKSNNVFEHQSERNFSFVAKSHKLVEMKRIFVEPKESEDSKNPQEGSSRRDYTVKETYQEVLDKLLKPGQLPPRTVTDNLDNKIRLARDIEFEHGLE